MNMSEQTPDVQVKHETSEVVLSIRDLRVEYPSATGTFVAVDNVSLDVRRGEILGLVGESGAGKSTIGWAVTRLIDAPGRVVSGRVELQGEGNLLDLTDAEMCRIRGRKIGLIFQDPLSALNPVTTVGSQLRRAIRLATGMTGEANRERAIELLTDVGIPDPRSRMRQYPHQFSGGMRQRIVIAIALAGNPKLLIADEPTTALDVSVQSEILKLIRRLGQKHDAGVILVTHDMAVIREITDRVAVMRHGRLIEIGKRNDVLDRPRADYTQALIRAVPRTDVKLDRFELVSGADHSYDSEGRTTLAWAGAGAPATPMADQAPIVEVRDLSVRFLTKNALLARNRLHHDAVKNVSLAIQRGETLGLVGESGSGKSTLARAICGLQNPTSGDVTYLGHPLKRMRKAPDLRRDFLSLQMIFQDPFSSLNPRQRVGQLLGEPLRIHGLANGNTVEDIVVDLLERVGLSAEDRTKFPHQFSGGQRQRIGIARALTVQPKFLICDEPTSALDVSVQAQVLNLLKDLQSELGLTMLFVSHDLAVIRQMSDRIAVMRQGELCEVVPSEQLFEAPGHSYTRELLTLMPKFAGS